MGGGDGLGARPWEEEMALWVLWEEEMSTEAVSFRCKGSKRR